MEPDNACVNIGWKMSNKSLIGLIIIYQISGFKKLHMSWTVIVASATQKSMIHT